MIILSTAEIIGIAIAALGLCGAIFKFAVIRPLENTITNLTDTVNRLRDALKYYDDRLRSLEIHIAELEQRVRSNQHRLDSLEAKKHEMGH